MITRTLNNIRYVRHYLEMAARLRSWRWARSVLAAGIPPDEVQIAPSGRQIFFKKLNVSVPKRDSPIFRGYQYARHLIEAGGILVSDNTDDLTIIFHGIKAAINTWDDLFILWEIHINGAYRINGIKPDLILDIGCNVGHAALYFASVYPEARIVGFEPVAANLVNANRNFDLNPRLSKNISTCNFGLAAQNGTAKVDHCIEKPGCTGLYPLPDDVSSGSECVRYNVDFRDVSSVCDQYLKSPDCVALVKIDCEGSEYQIIQRLKDSGHLRSFSAIVGEWHRRNAEQNPADLVESLSCEGFLTILLGDPNKPSGMIYAINRFPQSK